MAIGIATQQTTLLDSFDSDIGQPETSVERLGAMLVMGEPPNQEPDWIMVGVWQAPHMLLNYSAHLFFGALSIHICDIWIPHQMCDDSKVRQGLSYHLASANSGV
jgi:hypothetical protein